jgi:hypothetical protein
MMNGVNQNALLALFEPEDDNISGASGSQPRISGRAVSARFFDGGEDSRGDFQALQPLETAVDGMVNQEQMVAVLSSVFAALALVLAAT